MQPEPEFAWALAVMDAALLLGRRWWGRATESFQTAAAGLRSKLTSTKVAALKAGIIEK